VYLVLKAVMGGNSGLVSPWYSCEVIRTNVCHLSS